MTYTNNAILDKTAKTITFNDVTYSYAPDGDRYVLTAPDDSVLYTENDKWLVDERNDLIIRGDDTEGYYWIYDAEGNLSVRTPIPISSKATAQTTKLTMAPTHPASSARGLSLMVTAPPR